MTFTGDVVPPSTSPHPREWFMVPAMGFMRDLGQGQDDNLLGRSWQPPEGLAVSSLAAAGGNLGVPASLASE